MNKEEIIKIAKIVGVNKGYRINHPEDWYAGFREADLCNKVIMYQSKITKYFGGLNGVVLACFPKYNFLEWKFMHVKSGFWKKRKNRILYLKWFGKEMGWNKPEDWYKISQQTLIENYGRHILQYENIKTILRMVYPKYNFDFSKLNVIPEGYWDDFEVLKNFLLPKCEKLGRMLTTNEILEIKGLQYTLQKHGGLIKVAKKLGLNVSSQYKTLSGHIVKSTCEVIVDNFLFLNNIKFEYEKKIIESENYICDFKVKNYYIEIWGLEDSRYNKEYNKTKKIKKKLYCKNKLKLISLSYNLFSKRLNKINEELKNIINISGIKTRNFYDGDIKKLMSFESYDKESVLKELYDECVRLKINKFPTQEWWIEHGFKRHIVYIWNHNLKTSDIIKQFGFEEPSYKPYGYWKDWENLKKELLPICDRLGHFPTHKYLGGDLLHAIDRYYGGIRAVETKLGYELHNAI